MLACQNRLRGGVLERYSKYEVEDHVGRTNGIWGMMEMENLPIFILDDR